LFLCQSKTSFDEKGNSEQNSKIFLFIVLSAYMGLRS
jgi:hypothetical protein